MNRSIKLLGIVILLSFIVAIFCTSLETYRNDKKLAPDGFNHLGISPVLNVSDYIKFTGPPVTYDPYEKPNVKFRINIAYRPRVNYTWLNEANYSNYHWNKWAAEYEWCSGSGTPNDPYIIENLFFDLQGVGGGMLIEDSREHFIVRNCWFNHSGRGELDAGIYIIKSGNGTITNNIFTNIQRSVLIHLNGDINITNINITNNYIVGYNTGRGGADGGGFQLCSEPGCESVLFEGNKLINCYYPIHIWGIRNTTIKNNYILNTAFEDMKVPIKLVEVNDSKVIYNAFDGLYSKLETFVLIIGGSGNNIVKNNTQVVNSTASSSASVCMPKFSSSTDTNLLELENCYNNLIAHNRVYISRSGANILGYDIFVILGVLGIISMIVAKKVIKR